MDSIPPDDPRRELVVAQADGTKQSHIGLVGDTYTILLTGKDTAGRYSLIDMYIPQGGGPPPHRHDFEELFTVLEGEIEAVFRGVSSTVRAGEAINSPANAPHQFRNQSERPARLLMYLFTGWAGRNVSGTRGSRRDPDDSAAEARWGCPKGIKSQVGGACGQVSDRVFVKGRI